MPYDPIHALRDKRVRGADAEFKCEARTEGPEAMRTEEGAGEGDEDAGEKCRGEGGERDEGGGGGDVEGVEERMGEGRWTVAA